MSRDRPGAETQRVDDPGGSDHAWADELETLSELVTQLGVLPREQFLRRVLTPYLLVLGSSGDVGDDTFTTRTCKSARGDVLEPRVLAVRKRTDSGGNPFGIMITLGRADNNDLVLHHGTVSKFHCYFREESGREDSGWTIVDAGSTNGTILDGEQLVPHRPKKLRPRAQIDLGKELRVVFVTPAQLFDELYAQ